MFCVCVCVFSLRGGGAAVHGSVATAVLLRSGDNEFPWSCVVPYPSNSTATSQKAARSTKPTLAAFYVRSATHAYMNLFSRSSSGRQHDNMTMTPCFQSFVVVLSFPAVPGGAWTGLSVTTPIPLEKHNTWDGHHEANRGQPISHQAPMYQQESPQCLP